MAIFVGVIVSNGKHDCFIVEFDGEVLREEIAD